MEKSSNSHGPLGTHLSLWVFKRNDSKYYDPGALVDHLADPDHFWHAHSMQLCLIFSWCFWNDLLYFLVYLLILAHVWTVQIISSSLICLITSSLTKYLGLSKDTSFLSPQVWHYNQWDQACLFVFCSG